MVVPATAATEPTTTTVAITTTAAAPRTTTTTVATPALTLEVATATAGAVRGNLLETIAIGGRSRLSGGGSSDRSVLSPTLGAGSGGRLVNGLSLSGVTRNHLKALRKRVVRARNLSIPLLGTGGVRGSIVDASGSRGGALGSRFAISGGSGRVKLGQPGVGNSRVGANGSVFSRRGSFSLGDVLHPSFLGGEGSVLDRSLLDLGVYTQVSFVKKNIYIYLHLQETESSRPSVEMTCSSEPFTSFSVASTASGLPP